jgi:serine protease Do
MTPTPSTHPAFDAGALPSAVERAAASTVGLVLHRGAASGVLWQPGVVVTAASVLWRARSLQLLLPGGEPVAGMLRGVDTGTDLAAVAFEGDGGPPCERAANAEPRVGEFVFAVGREPSGRVQASFGHVGAAGGEWRTWRGARVERLIRLDGGLYPGLAGAPVADANGRVLGVASPALSRHHGVVLPVATVERVLQQLLAHGRVRRAHLGVAVQPARAVLDGNAVEGLLVSSVAQGGSAARAGLLVGDVIVAVAGQGVASIEALRDALVVLAEAAAEAEAGFGTTRPLALLGPAASPPQVVAAVAAVLQGLSVREATAGFAHAALPHAAADHEPLTPRELEVFELIGKGLSNRDIAGLLGISAHTAKYHVAQILAKVGAATRAEAVSTGLRFGIIGL